MNGSTVPCCPNQAKHRDCPAERHVWERRILNLGTGYEQQTDRCQICHLNREAAQGEGA